jgi:hypothetical protein
VFALVVLLALGAGVWLFRDQLLVAWRDFRGAEEAPRPSPELADQAERKLVALADGSSRSVALSEVELQSLLQYRYQGIFPAFLDSPTVELREDQVRLRARVAVDNLPSVDGLGDVAAFLPDTTELLLAGKLLPLDSGRIALGVDDVSASRVPLPRRLVRAALERIGRVDEPGLPRDAVAVPLPPGVGAAYIRGDSLHLLARQGGARN